MSKRNVHFIGIGGAGLSALATVLSEQGDLVSGSDRQASPMTQRLQEAGIHVSIGHRPENVAGADLVVRSSAIPDHNPEVQTAQKLGIPVLKRVDFLPHLTAGKQTLAVAGAHGKTTTTAWLAWLLQQLGQDPSFVIGSVAPNLNANAHAGQGRYFVIEADEYDYMFLGLAPLIAVVTNVEYDHPDCFPTPADFTGAFERFVNRIQPGGVLLANRDDPGALGLTRRIPTSDIRSCTFSILDPQADYFAANLHLQALGGYSFDFLRQGGPPILAIQLQLPGLHNVSNALAALGVVDLLGLPLEAAIAACEQFVGTGRRFEVRGVVNGVTVIDDYAHHPTEIQATLAAGRARFPKQKIWAVWQPHTFSRTRTLLDAFSQAFQAADRVVITEIFAARETVPADRFSAENVYARLKLNAINGQTVDLQPDLSIAVKFLLDQVEPGDVVMVLSAGDADQISTRLLADLASNANHKSHSMETE